RIGRRIKTDWIERVAVPKSSQPPSNSKGKVKIGIRWNSGVDLDLYVRPAPGAAELYYGRSRTREGALNKDYISNAASTRGYETVEFDEEVDVNNLLAFVNFYSGEVGSAVDAIVRVEFNGEFYEAHFTISATRGNKGEDYEGRQNSSYWCMLDIPQVVGLRK
ncbi:MAG TPA: hypothetical protein VF511_00880, partial [Chthoniobacterales bacterium]